MMTGRLIPVLLCLGFVPVCAAVPLPEWEAPSRDSLLKMAEQLGATVKPWTVPSRTFRVRDYGAVGDGVSVNTIAFQRAIDACTAAGGGVVLVDRGDFVVGTIELKSGVMLQVDQGARILGSLHASDYPDRTPGKLTAMDTSLHITKSLIYANECERVGIRGEGIIDGRGEKKNWPRKNDNLPHAPVNDRPFLIRVIDSRQVMIDGIHLRNSPSWMEDYVNCDDLILHGVNVENQGNYNNDGFDIDGCRNVVVRDCFINSWDDAMCFKGAGLRTMQNVLVEDCTAYSGCNALKFGTNSEGGFENVVVRNVKLGGVPKDLPAFKRRNATSGVSWESVDGGTLRNLLVSGATIDHVDSPLFLRVGNRRRDGGATGSISRVMFEKIRGEGNGARGSIFAGVPGGVIGNVVVRDMKLSMAGGQKPRVSTGIAEKVGDYPDSNMFGELSPAFGFWMRHVNGVWFEDVKINPVKPDGRPEFVSGVDATGIQLNGEMISEAATTRDAAQ